MIQRALYRSFQPTWRQSQCMRPAGALTTFAFQPRSAAPAAAQRSHQRRWNSSQEQQSEREKDAVLEEQGEVVGQQELKAGEAPQLDPLHTELEAKKREVIDVTDRLKRSIADYRNLQDQTKREIQASRDFALQRFAKDLLGSIDNLDRALSVVPTEKLNDANKELKDLHGGLRMTEQILLSTLQKHGLERFDPTETKDRFDPNKMEATFMAPQADKEDGSVFHTQSKGFLLNGRVLRAAKVGVVKNS